MGLAPYPLVGLISGANCGNSPTEIHPLFSQSDNAVWITQVMTRARPFFTFGGLGWMGEDVSSGLDADGDGVPEDNGEDNCPVDYNPDQFDSDLDRIGDVCDPFPTKDNSSLSESPRDSNLDSELINYDLLLHDHRPITASDSAEFVKGRALHYQADGLEKIALVRVNAANEITKADALYNGEIAANTKIEFDRIHPILTKQKLSYGFRFCICLPEDIDLNKPESRIQCHTRAICPFQGNSFNPQNLPEQANPWFKIHLDTNSPDTLFQDQFAPTQLKAIPTQKALSWRVFLDPNTWLTPPTIGHPETLTTRGILWGHALPAPAGDKDSFINNGADIGPDPSHPVAQRDRSNVFINGSVKVRKSILSGTPGLLGSSFGKLPLTFCKECFLGWKKSFFLSLGSNLTEPVVAFNQRAQQDVTEWFPPEVRSSLRKTSVVRATFTEPDWVLEHHNPSHLIAASLNADFSFDTAFTVEDNGVVLSPRGRNEIPFEGSEPIPVGVSEPVAPIPPAEIGSLVPPPSASYKVVGSASQGVLFLVRGQGDGGDGNLWRLDLRSFRWWATPYLRATPIKILSAAYRFSDNALYALDEITQKNVKRARLLRINQAGEVTVLTSWPRLLKADVDLSLSQLDELVFSFSKGNTHAVLVASVRDGKLKPTFWSVDNGKLLTSPQVTDGWVHKLVEKNAKPQALDVPREPIASLALLLGGLGWW